MSMIDLHCHILPGVDDGARNINESIAMAEQAVSQGITHILCTPHHLNGKYINPAHKIKSRVKDLQSELDRRHIPLTVMAGQEVRINGSLLDSIKQNELLFIDLKNKYLLIELPTLEIPSYTETLFFKIISSGYTPIIVHPERNLKIQENPNLIVPFLEMGVLTQLTAPSIVGIYGKKVQKIARIMLKHNMIHMVASDAHGINKRNFHLKEAYESIRKNFGEERVESMKKTTENLIDGDCPEIPKYEMIIKRGLFKKTKIIGK